MSNLETINPKYVPPAMRVDTTPITGFAPTKSTVKTETTNIKYTPPAQRQPKKETFDDMFPDMLNKPKPKSTTNLNYAILFSKQVEPIELKIEEIENEPVDDTERIVVVDTSDEVEEKEPSQWSCLLKRHTWWLAREKAIKNSNITSKKRGNLFEYNDDEDEDVYQSDEITEISSHDEEEEQEEYAYDSN